MWREKLRKYIEKDFDSLYDFARYAGVTYSYLSQLIYNDLYKATATENLFKVLNSLNISRGRKLSLLAEILSDRYEHEITKEDIEKSFKEVPLKDYLLEHPEIVKELRKKGVVKPHFTTLLKRQSTICKTAQQFNKWVKALGEDIKPKILAEVIDDSFMDLE